MTGAASAVGAVGAAGAVAANNVQAPVATDAGAQSNASTPKEDPAQARRGARKLGCVTLIAAFLFAVVGFVGFVSVVGGYAGMVDEYLPDWMHGITKTLGQTVLEGSARLTIR